MFRKILKKLTCWFADMSEAFTEQIKKCVLSSTAIQTFFYVVFAAILVGSFAGDVELIRTLAILILVFVSALVLGISIRNQIEIHKGCKRLLEIEKEWEKESSYSIFAPLPTICLGDENGVNLPVDSISITVEQEESAGLWEFDEKDNADLGFYCSVSDTSVCFKAVGKDEASDFLKREEAEWKMIDEGLCGGVCGGGHAGIDE